MNKPKKISPWRTILLSAALIVLFTSYVQKNKPAPMISLDEIPASELIQKIKGSSPDPVARAADLNKYQDAMRSLSGVYLNEDDKVSRIYFGALKPFGKASGDLKSFEAPGEDFAYYLPVKPTQGDSYRNSLLFKTTKEDSVSVASAQKRASSGDYANYLVRTYEKAINFINQDKKIALSKESGEWVVKSGDPGSVLTVTYLATNGDGEYFLRNSKLSGQENEMATDEPHQVTPIDYSIRMNPGQFKKFKEEFPILDDYYINRIGLPAGLSAQFNVSDTYTGNSNTLKGLNSGVTPVSQKPSLDTASEKEIVSASLLSAIMNEQRFSSTVYNVTFYGKDAYVNMLGGLETGTYESRRYMYSSNLPDITAVANLLDEKKIEYSVRNVIPDEKTILETIMGAIFVFLPILLLIGFMWYSKAGMTQKMKTSMVKPDDINVDFSKIKGIDEVKHELYDIVDYIQKPEKFSRTGSHVPKGVLLVGSPGVGKTFIAKAIAKESGASFFAVSGSDFMEMFVGLGAARVRKIFAEARKHAPSIIFIDEIDIIGKSRSSQSNFGGSHSEQEQTINALLVEMDGFNDTSGVIVIAATNRAEILDAALTRAGRFDRQVFVPLPSMTGRKEILELYMQDKPAAGDVDLGKVAKRTVGFSGASLANLVNEAAIMAAKRGGHDITNADFDNAYDKTIMGLKNSSVNMSEHEKKVTAYHEAGHAIVGMHYEPDGMEPVSRVSIVPRGQALGVTIMIPEAEKYGYSKTYMKHMISMLLSGRIAEEVFIGDITTGASNDIERVTDLAYKMVTKFGMSDLGLINFEPQGNSLVPNILNSQSLQQEINNHVRQIVDECYEKAKEIIIRNRASMHRMAQELLDKESIDLEELKSYKEDVAKTKLLAQGNPVEISNSNIGPLIFSGAELKSIE